MGRVVIVEAEVDLGDIDIEDLRGELKRRKDEIYNSHLLAIEGLRAAGCPEELLKPVELWANNKLSLSDLLSVSKQFTTLHSAKG